MKILLYNPDNGVTRNFMPHLWMFLLQSLTPSEHEVALIDGNTRPMSEPELVRYLQENGIGLVGIGAMTRTVAKAYRVADAVRAAGIPVVMGGPHVTELPDEALGHADAVAVGEADEIWPGIIADASAGKLKKIYSAVDEFGQSRKPDLAEYPAIPWESLDIDQFNRIPGFFRRIMEHYRTNWETFHIIPIESGRGCPYGCEFCTVTGFFGDSIRFRTNESIVDEILRLKARARLTRGQFAVFFVDDNFAINVKRTKALLRDIIEAGAQIPWVGQISANLLRDDELVDLIAESGGRWIFIGMESLNPENLASVNKNFVKPADYGAVLEKLARRNVYAITSFIFGLDHDKPGVADRTLAEMRDWPPGLPVFGQITPFPSTPLYDRLEKEGRLTRPKHWLEFTPFHMAHTPLGMSGSQVQAEVRRAWTVAYGPEWTRRALDYLATAPSQYAITQLIARIIFGGIYFPRKGVWPWLKVIAQNSGTIARLIWRCSTAWRSSPPAPVEYKVDPVGPGELGID